MNWTEYFTNIAEVVKTKSKDINTQIGAVIVGRNREIVSTGYNSFPRGIKDDIEERQLRPEKYFFMVHAEQNAIINAARIGVSTNNCTMYLTCGLPCADCTKAIINAGIRTVYCKSGGSGAKDARWEEHAVRSQQMFKEADVRVIFY
jgi:dCMP deaminase